MMRIVATPAQAMDNIVKFENELKKSPELQARLAYARSWYAYNEDDRWWFAPSKFVGYQDIDAQKYLESAEDSDGRRTEAQLQSYFGPLDPSGSDYAELFSKLVAFLAKYGKTPSTKTRINIQRARRRLSSDSTAENGYASLVRVIVAVARTLPSNHFQTLREELEDMWA